MRPLTYTGAVTQQVVNSFNQAHHLQVSQLHVIITEDLYTNNTRCNLIFDCNVHFLCINFTDGSIPPL